MPRRFQRLFILAALLLAMVPAVRPVRAAETLYPQFFWRAPAGLDPNRSLVITAGAAYPDGGLAVAGYREGERERYLYRIDAAGKTMWELKIETGDGAIGTLVRDARDGLVFCGGQNKVRRVDAEGRLDWVAADWRSPGGEFMYPYLHDTNDCDALLALPDGSVIVASTILYSDAYPTVRTTRIDPAGKTSWSSDMAAHAPDEGRVAALVALPDGDVEVVFDPRLPISNAHPPFLESPAFWEWRISPDGRWRAQNRMQEEVPLRANWFGIEALYRLRDRLVRVGEPIDEGNCRMSFEEWSLDGNRLLGRGYLPPLGKCEGDWDTGYSDYPSSILAPRDLSADFLATVARDIPIVWYRLAPPARLITPYRFEGQRYDARLPRGHRIYLFGGPSDIYVVDLPS